MAGPPLTIGRKDLQEVVGGKSLSTTLLRGWTTVHVRLTDDNGATLVEYALLVALISIIAIAAMQNLGGSLTDQYDNIANCIDDPSLPCELP